MWHNLLTKSFTQASLNKIESTSFIFKNGGNMVICYVGDILMFSKHQTEMNNVKQKLEKDSILRDLRELTHFLAMEIN